MRVVIALLASLLLVGSAVAADIAKGPNVVEGTPTVYQNTLTRADFLVVSIIQGTFTDMGPTWVTALGSADLMYDPAGVYPDLSGYQMILVDTADMWWSYSFAADESAWTTYHANGGCVFVVGQDYLYSRGSTAGFPMTVLGMASVSQDVAYDTTTIEWYGVGILDGLSGVLTACFASNGFFSDNVTPAEAGIAEWSDEMGAGGEAGCTAANAGLSTIEFGCGPDVAAVAAAFVGHCGGVIPTENTSWGQIKSIFE